MPTYFVHHKAIVLVGEPDCPISTNVRAHNRSLTHADKPLGPSDHDFHTWEIVPSFTLKADISVLHPGVFSYHSIGIAAQKLSPIRTRFVK